MNRAVVTFAPRKAERFDPQKAFEIAFAEGRTLGEIVHQTNKESNNLYAELILRTLGKERGSLAPDPDPRKNRERGDDEAGVAVVKSWLDRNSIPTNGLAIRDGSGLSRLDLVRPATSWHVQATAEHRSRKILWRRVRSGEEHQGREGSGAWSRVFGCDHAAAAGDDVV